MLQPLIIKCNALLRILQDKPRTFHTRILYENYQTLPVNLLFKHFVIKLMHQVNFNSKNIPNIINKLFFNNLFFHNHNTRSKFEFNIPWNACPNSISFLGPSYWNKLPLNLKSLANFNAFLKMHKQTLYSEI